jgi:hydroxymethylpyrimidine/phosphomethylpyrimidine kinase
MPIAAIKIGMLGNVENIKIISRFIQMHPEIPVILDPVLAASGGQSLASQNLIDAICELLLPHTTVVTPNTLEASSLSKINAENQAACAEKILSYNCQAVLITGTHADTNNIVNTLFVKNNAPISFACERLPHHYHGSGCTLAASLAALIARGFSFEMAAEKALDYTWQTLLHAKNLGSGQFIPNRFYAFEK